MRNTEGVVELSVNGILAAIDDFQREAGARDYRARSGLEPALTDSARSALLGEVTQPETVAFVRELSTSTRLDAVKKHRVERLLALVLELAVRARLASAADGCEAALAQTVTAAGRTWRLDEALRDGWSLGSTEARSSLSKAVGATLWDSQAPFSRRLEALLESAPALGRSHARGLVEGLHRRTFDALLPMADELLRLSDDATRDLTGFVLKRLEPQLKLAAATEVDLERALAAPWTFELLRREDLSHAVARTLGDLGLHPSALGRIQVDSEARAGAQPSLIRVEVPDQLRLVLPPGAGFEPYRRWLGLWAEAHWWAAVPRTLPFIDRVVGDAAVPLAVRRLFESLLLDEGWLKRALRVTSPQARELARVFAWRQLVELRVEASRLSTTKELLERGASRTVAEAFVSGSERASFVRSDKGRFLVELDPLAPGLTTLEAWGFEAALHTQVRERFNEDWWRNPAAGRFLGDLAARGVSDDVATWATTLGQSSRSPADAARRRVVVMGA